MPHIVSLVLLTVGTALAEFQEEPFVPKPVVPIPKWNYRDGPFGPENWSQSYPECGLQRQSPINLLRSAQSSADVEPLKFSFHHRLIKTMTVAEKNFTYEMQIPESEQSKLTLSGGNLPGKQYKLLQFHWHFSQDDQAGSEHAVDGIFFPMDSHLVYQNMAYGTVAEALTKPDGLAVVGVFYHLQESPANTLGIGSISQAITRLEGPGSKLNILQRVMNHLPAERSVFWRYEGSLTTPPCSPAVSWVHMTHTLPITRAQLNNFRLKRDPEGRIVETNIRPLQGLFGREPFLRRDKPNDPGQQGNSNVERPQ